MLKPEAHRHGNLDPHIVAIIEKSWYRTRKMAARVTPRVLAKYHLYKELGRGMSEDMILSNDSYSGCAYWSVSYGPYCGPTKYGNMRVKLYQHKEEFFSMRELLTEIRKEKRQQSLF